MLDFIVDKPKQHRKQYGMCFYDLKMDLSEEMSSRMAAIGNEMAKEHMGSFCFLSNYLYGSCLALSDRGVPIGVIEDRYKGILKILCQKYRPAPEIEGKHENLDCHPNYKRSDLIPNLEVGLKGRNNKD